jgi:hypothetical protein
LLDNDFNAFRISASVVVLSTALVASSHIPRKSNETEFIRHRWLMEKKRWYFIYLCLQCCSWISINVFIQKQIFWMHSTVDNGDKIALMWVWDSTWWTCCFILSKQNSFHSISMQISNIPILDHSVNSLDLVLFQSRLKRRWSHSEFFITRVDLQIHRKEIYL